MAQKYSTGYVVVDSDPNTISNLQHTAHQIKLAIHEDGSKIWRFVPLNSSSTRWVLLNINGDAETLDGLNSSDFARLNNTTVNDEFLLLNRNSTNPTLYVNQYGTGDIARFYRGSANGAVSSISKQLTITNEGGIVATGDVTSEGTVQGDGFLISNNNSALINAFEKTVSFNDGGWARTLLSFKNTEDTSTTPEFKIVNFGGGANNRWTSLGYGGYNDDNVIKVTPTGAVGIGVTPTQKLDVNGNVNANNFIGDGSILGKSTVGGTSNVLSLINPNNGTGVAVGMNFSAVVGDTPKAGIYFENSGVGNGRGVLHFALNSNANSDDVTIDDSVLNINHLGNVSIGTITANAGLTVNNATSVGRTLLVKQPNTSISTGAYTFEVDSTSHTSNVSTAGAMKVDTASGRAFTINGLGNVSIGTTSPSDGDLTINAPKLHVVGPGTGGTYNLVARFQAGNDSDNTGSAILINHSNDRGLLIKAGRKDGDREVAYFDVISSGGNITNMLTMGKFGSDYNVGIGTTSPSSKVTIIDGDIKIGTNNTNSATSYGIRMVEYSNTSFTGFYTAYNGSTNQFNIWSHSTNNNLVSDDVKRFSIDRDSGNIAIGDVSVIGQKLNVDGKVMATFYKSTTDLSTESITLNTSNTSTGDIKCTVTNNRVILTGSFTSNSNTPNIVIGTLPTLAKPTITRYGTMYEAGTTNIVLKITIETNGEVKVNGVAKSGESFIIDTEFTKDLSLI